MKYQAEFRDPEVAHQLLAAIRQKMSRPWQIMEVCGGQTHSILQYGLDELLPDDLTLIHGPGCPVCVTPQSVIDDAVRIAIEHQGIICSYGDMLRVPGTSHSLMEARAAGGDVRVIYSPNDAIEIALQETHKQVVFLAIGFETTTAVNAMAAIKAKSLGLSNFSMLVSQVTVPAALKMIAAQPDCVVDGFLAAGHVCTVMGEREYPVIASEFHKPIVITGFEPVDILLGIERCVEQLESGKAYVENAYKRSVKPQGNASAQAFIEKVFERVDKDWRGIGVIPASGFALSDAFADLDASRRFFGQVEGNRLDNTVSDNICQAGQVLQGHIKPPECAAFRKQCTPDKPLGAPMVSEEGACHAYYRYRCQ